MLRNLLILFSVLVLPITGMSADKKINLHLEPKTNSKIIGAIRNTEALVLVEKNGIWSKVIDGESGLIGWVQAPLNNSLTVDDKI
jgi:hypothetical protein